MAVHTVQVKTHAQYDADLLKPETFPATPLPLFRQWLQEAIDFPCAEPEAIALSTASARGIPSVRFVLLKEIDKRGIVFFTNYESRKGREMAENPFASVATYWKEQHRSVRVVGRVERLDHDATQAYFSSRPLGSRVGAWASPQSRVLPDRTALEKRVEAIEHKFGIATGRSQDAGEEATADREIEAPPYWGGMRIVPDEVEFWAGQPSRLHDRFVYTRTGGASHGGDDDDADGGTWSIQRLAP